MSLQDATATSARPAKVLHGSTILAAIKSSVAFVISVPDLVTSEGLLRPLAAGTQPRLVRICKEDEGIGIAAGMAFGGVRSLLLIQHTGFLDSINALRAVAVEYSQPICLMVGLLAKEPDCAPENSKNYGVRIVVPILRDMGIRYHVIDSDEDVAVVAPEIERAYADGTPVVFLISRSPLAS